MYTNHRVFDWNSQEAFARVSADYNPIHMDPISARRTQTGAPIVHGVHSLIWILECFAQSELYTLGHKSLKVQFLKPIYVGDEVKVEISKSTTKAFRARISVDSEEVINATIGFEVMKLANLPVQELSLLRPAPPPNSPDDRDLDEVKGLSGCLGFGQPVSDITALFPAAVRAFGFSNLAALAYSSCLVGMVAPGLHSIFSSLEISFSEDNTAPADAVQFSVVSILKRFGSVRIGVRTRGFCGFLEALRRAPPAKQPSIESVRSRVSPKEFLNNTALVVGGSRGLGELTAKLIVAGGGAAVITYARGKSDADAVVSEMRSSGFKCTTACYDVHQPALGQLAALGVAPTHVYYFPTPTIFRRKAGIFDPNRFAEFNLFYVTAFFDLVQTCIRLRPEGVKVFYPSSVFVNDRPANLAEYAMSKAAAEVLSADISRFVPGVEVLTRRLPRLFTDQTSSALHVEMTDPIEVLLPIVREMHR